MLSSTSKRTNEINRDRSICSFLNLHYRELLLFLCLIWLYFKCRKDTTICLNTTNISLKTIHTDLSGIKSEITKIKHNEQPQQLLTPYLLTKTKDNLWIVVINNELISIRILKNGIWEPETTSFFKKFVKPGEKILELGVNIGYFVTLLAKLTGPTGIVIGYEANKIVYDLARLSVKMNDMDSYVSLHNVAVSNHSGYVNFTYDIPTNKALSINAGTAHIVTDGMKNKPNYIEVKTITLDEDLPDLDEVDWLLIDIEGAELLALQGARRIIQSSPNIKIIMEWNERYLSSFSNVGAFLDEYMNAGFSFYKMSSSGVMSEPLTKAFLSTAGNLNTNALVCRNSSIPII